MIRNGHNQIHILLSREMSTNVAIELHQNDEDLINLNISPFCV